MKRGMWAWELKSLLQECLHPRWNTVWIEANRWGVRQREAAGLAVDMGTIMFAGTEGNVETPFSVRKGQLPEDTVIEWIYDDMGRQSDVKTAYKGWREMLTALVRQGYLRPHKKLDDWLGGHTEDLLKDSPWRL